MRYVVTGPERVWVDRILDDGSGPSYIERDVYLVDAPNRSAARWAAFALAKASNHLWWRDLDRASEHPLTGVTVEDGSDERPEDWGDLYVCAGP